MREHSDTAFHCGIPAFPLKRFDDIPGFYNASNDKSRCPAVLALSMRKHAE